MDIQIGSTITDGYRAVRINAVHEGRDGPVWRGLTVALEEPGMGTGTTAFLADRIAQTWKHVPFEWSPVVGSHSEERYVWSRGCRWLHREVRPKPECP